MVSQTLSCQHLILLQRWQIVKNNETGLKYLLNRIMIVVFESVIFKEGILRVSSSVSAKKT